MSARRPSDADVETVVASINGCISNVTDLPKWMQVPALGNDMRPILRLVARAVLASDWLAARDAEHEREVADLREQVAFLETELDADAKHAALAEGETCDVCTHLESEQVQRWMAEDEDRAEAAERDLADLRAAIKALAEMWVRDEDEGIEHVVGCQDYRCRECVVIACASDLRALLPRDDAAGAGGAR